MTIRFGAKLFKDNTLALAISCILKVGQNSLATHFNALNTPLAFFLCVV